jgi:hypothetical protein
MLHSVIVLKAQVLKSTLTAINAQKATSALVVDNLL